MGLEGIAYLKAQSNFYFKETIIYISQAIHQSQPYGDITFGPYQLHQVADQKLGYAEKEARPKFVKNKSYMLCGS